MEKNSQKILLFDIDGTLLEPAGVGRLCCRRALEDVLGFSGTFDSVEMAGRTDWQIVNDLLSNAGLAENQIDGYREKIFTALTDHIALAAPTSRMHPLPGVLDLLDRLAEEPRYILGLVTGNVRQTVPHKMQAVGIDPALFRFGAFGDEHQDRNNLPTLALHRLGQLLGCQVRPETVLVIGDTPHDIACARHADLKVLGVGTGVFPIEDLAKHQPDYLLKDLSDTEAVMEIFHQF